MQRAHQALHPFVGRPNWKQLVHSGWLLQKISKLSTDLEYDSFVSVKSGDLTGGLKTIVSCVLYRLVGDQLPYPTLTSEYDKTLTLIWTCNVLFFCSICIC